MADMIAEILIRKREAERVFATAAFNRPEQALAHCKWLKPEQINDTQVRQFWTSLLDTEDPIAAATSVDYDYLAQMAAGKYSGIDYYSSGIDQLADKIAIEHWFFVVGSRLSGLAMALKASDMAQAQAILAEIASDKPKATDQIPDTADIGLDFVASIDEEQRTICTGMKFDQALGGLWRGILTVLCARPSVGKTALALQLARNIAQAEHKVLFASLEMGQRELWARAVCGSTRIDYRDVVARRLSDIQKRTLIDKNTELIDLYYNRLFIDDQPQSTAEIWRKCDSIKPDMLVVDHLRLLSDPGDNETQRLGMMTWELKKIAREFDIAVLCLAQLNRQLENRQDKEPMLSDLRDSGQIEENADIVIGLHRDRDYLDKPVTKSPARARVLKFRSGPSNQVMNWMFDGPGQWFEDSP